MPISVIPQVTESTDFKPPAVYFVRFNDEHTGLPVAYLGPFLDDRDASTVAECEPEGQHSGEYSVVTADGQPANIEDYDLEGMADAYGPDWRERLYPRA